MDRKGIEAQLVCAIRTVLEDQNAEYDITSDTLLFQTGLDFSSLDGVMLIVKIEEVFNIKWPDELLHFDDNLTVFELVVIIESILNDEGVL